MEIPVYLIAGFLDSGKTTFINGILKDGFARQGRTLLICCEEGEEIYPLELVKENVDIVTVDEETDLKTSVMKKWEKCYRPEQILIEYNGMWSFGALNNLPNNWLLYQIITFVHAPTFDLYAKNMGQLMMEKIRNADMLVFNRCNPELRDMLRGRNLRMVNRRAEMYLENEDGSTENYLTGNECPFDLTQEVIDVPDEDFGVWYVDVMDHPERYEGKLVHMKLVMLRSKRYPNTVSPGRFAMVCCANDVQFLGIVAKGSGLDVYKNRDWVEVTARMTIGEHEAYKGKGPIMEIISISPCDKPYEEVVSF